MTILGVAKPHGIKEWNKANGDESEKKRKGIAVPPPASYDSQPKKSQNNVIKKIVTKDEIISK